MLNMIRGTTRWAMSRPRAERKSGQILLYRRFSLHVVNAVRRRTVLPRGQTVDEGVRLRGTRRRSLPGALERAVGAVLEPVLLTGFAVMKDIVPDDAPKVRHLSPGGRVLPCRREVRRHANLHHGNGRRRDE